MDKESWNHLFTEQSFGATIKIQKAFYFPFPLSFPLGLPDGFRLAAELAFSLEPDFETSGWTSEKEAIGEKVTLQNLSIERILEKGSSKTLLLLVRLFVTVNRLTQMNDKG